MQKGLKGGRDFRSQGKGGTRPHSVQRPQYRVSQVGEGREVHEGEGRGGGVVEGGRGGRGQAGEGEGGEVGGEGGEAGGGGEAGQELPLHRLQEERGEQGAEVETHPGEMSMCDECTTPEGIRIYLV